MAVDELPSPVYPAIDVGHANCHGSRGAAIDNHIAALETNRVGEVATFKPDDVLRCQCAALEAAAHPAERCGELCMPLLDGAQAPKSVASSEGAQQSM